MDNATKATPVVISPAKKSKINWAGIFTAAAGIGAVAGALPPKTGAVAAIIGGVSTVILRTWFTGTPAADATTAAN
jgi:hypothetical protein